MSSPPPRPEHGVIDIEHTINSSPTSIPNALPEPGDTDVVNNGDKDEDEESDSTEEDENSVRQPEPTAEEKAEQLERFVSKERVEYERDDDGSTDEDEDSDEEENSEDESDEEEEQQPLFKYKRIEGSVPTVLARRESASALTIANKRIALGTHSGIVHVMDLTGSILKSFKAHTASIMDIRMDSTADFVATASLDGQVVIHSISTSESYVFDLKRPMRTVSLEPDFASRGTRSFVCGGTAGTLVLHEKGWLGHKETLLHQGEGPIYTVRWRARLIAWANDSGVKIYDMDSQTRIAYIERPENAPRADLFKCTLLWQDDATLLIGWADRIKVARVRARVRPAANTPPLAVEVISDYQLDCMIAGLVPHPTPHEPLVDVVSPPGQGGGKLKAHAITGLLVLGYTAPENTARAGDDEALPSDSSNTKRQAAPPPELRLVSRGGEELSQDVLPIAGAAGYACNDYALVSAHDETVGEGERAYVVLSPRELILVRGTDRRDRIRWLVSQERFEEALDEVERLQSDLSGHPSNSQEEDGEDAVDVSTIGQRYIEHLVSEGDFAKAAHLCPKVCGTDAKKWEDWIYAFAEHGKLQTIIPYVPVEHPRLDHFVYEVILADLAKHDLEALYDTIRRWPSDIYEIPVVIIAVRSQLDRVTATASRTPTTTANSDAEQLQNCLADLYLANRQPGKALPLFLTLRRPGVFELIREHRLFADVQDEALRLVQFDHELMDARKAQGMTGVGEEEEDAQRGGKAIGLLVDHIHSIPIHHVVQQLQPQPYYLFLYLDALFRQDPYVVSDFADTQVQLYARFAPARLIDFLRASDFYSLQKAYTVCKEADLVPEMVFILGRMGGTNNKLALTLIIERLGDVHRAIDFAKEQADDDLWEDLLRYSETRPTFIRGLLEHVGPEIDPLRLIRRIQNGLEIPGLKTALLTILHDFQLQRALLEGCKTVLDGDVSSLARRLQVDQNKGFGVAGGSGRTKCAVCEKPLMRVQQSLVLLFLCRHAVHAACVSEAERLEAMQPDSVLAALDVGEGSYARALGSKIALGAVIRSRMSGGCPVCTEREEGRR